MPRITRLIGDVDQPAGFELHVAHQVHPRRVAVPAIHDHGHVDVHDVAVAQRLLFRNAVADDMVDRGAERVAIAAITQAGRDTAIRGHVVEGDFVELGRRDARLHRRDHEIEDLGRQATGLAHPLEAGLVMNRYRQVRAPYGFKGIGFGHHGHGEPI
jgi:hypothetical protein